MAHKARSFKVDEKKKAVIRYTNVEQDAGEKELYEYYLANGYRPLLDTKKPTITIEDMRKALKADEKASKEFEKLYSEKGGFHKACKFFGEWKKGNK